MRRWKWLIVILALIGIALFSLNRIIHAATRKAITTATGFDLLIGDMDVRLLNQSFEVKNLTLRNPPDFPDPEAFDIRRLYVRFDLLSFLGPTVHLHEVVLDVPQVVLVKKSDGETNLDRLKQAGEKLPSQETGKAGGEEEGQPPEKKFLIDTLNVGLGTIEYRDFTHRVGDRPAVRRIEADYQGTFKYVDSVKAIMGQIITDALVRSGITDAVESIANSEEARKFSEGINKAAKKLGKAIGGLFKKKDSEPSE